MTVALVSSGLSSGVADNTDRFSSASGCPDPFPARSSSEESVPLSSRFLHVRIRQCHELLARWRLASLAGEQHYPVWFSGPLESSVQDSVIEETVVLIQFAKTEVFGVVLR